MAAGLGLDLELVSLSTHLKKSVKSQSLLNTRSSNGTRMWNNKLQQMSEDEDDSWEVRAFEEDTAGNLMGCTWPPRSYTCTFCRREFRSAQALGGHMNVHRRDRARLHGAPPPLNTSPATPNKAPPSTLLIPTQELLANGLCLLYSLPNPNGVLINGTMDFPLAAAQSAVSSLCHSNITEPSASSSNDNNHCNNEMSLKDSTNEEVDLELRLGWKPPPPEEGR
ncbi:hypothetical protein Pfo_025809 [Paulownia fortunei]|nr:hypothetical protein Pfo_025809 [Paulownia fortunei]